MAMTLRPDTELAEALRLQAEHEGRSQSAVALDAVREYVTRRGHKARVAESARFGARHYAVALKELGST